MWPSPGLGRGATFDALVRNPFVEGFAHISGAACKEAPLRDRGWAARLTHESDAIRHGLGEVIEPWFVASDSCRCRCCRRFFLLMITLFCLDTVCGLVVWLIDWPAGAFFDTLSVYGKQVMLSCFSSPVLFFSFVFLRYASPRFASSPCLSLPLFVFFSYLFHHAAFRTNIATPVDKSNITKWYALARMQSKMQEFRNKGNIGILGERTGVSRS